MNRSRVSGLGMGGPSKRGVDGSGSCDVYTRRRLRQCAAGGDHPNLIHPKETTMQRRTKTLLLVAALGGAGLLAACGNMMKSGGTDMSFFVTSANPGKGADLGGLDGADKYCQSLAGAAGASGKTWRAYLSTSGAQAVNARDRIGSGPWKNA